MSDPENELVDPEGEADFSPEDLEEIARTAAAQIEPLDEKAEREAIDFLDGLDEPTQDLRVETVITTSAFMLLSDRFMFTQRFPICCTFKQRNRIRDRHYQLMAECKQVDHYSRLWAFERRVVSVYYVRPGGGRGLQKGEKPRAWTERNGDTCLFRQWRHLPQYAGRYQSVLLKEVAADELKIKLSKRAPETVKRVVAQQAVGDVVKPPTWTLLPVPDFPAEQDIRPALKSGFCQYPFVTAALSSNAKEPAARIRKTYYIQVRPEKREKIHAEQVERTNLANQCGYFAELWTWEHTVVNNFGVSKGDADQW